MAKFDPKSRLQAYREAQSLIASFFHKGRDTESAVYKLRVYDSQSPEELEPFYSALDYLVLLAKMDKLAKIVHRILLRPSRERVHVLTDSVGQIRGQFDMRHYVQKLGRVETPPTFSCYSNEAVYEVPENDFLCFVLHYVLRRLNSVPLGSAEFWSTPQGERARRWIAYLRRTLNNALFQSSIERGAELARLYDQGNVAPIDRLVATIERRRQRKAVENSAYGELLVWFREITARTITGGDNADVDVVFLDESFDDRLYELWLLYHVARSFENTYGLRKVSGPMPLYLREEGPIYSFSTPTGKEVKIYYQKSEGLVWGNTPAGDLDVEWCIKGTADKLRGFLDIVITYDDAKDHPPILIDAKNVYYTENAAVSEKVYKMVGYLDNFRRFAKRGRGATGVLVLRPHGETAESEASDLPVREYISGRGEPYDLIAIFTAAPGADGQSSRKLGAERVDRMCGFILDRFGLLNTGMRLFAEGRQQRDIFQEELRQAEESNDEDKVNEIAHAICVQVHRIVEEKLQKHMHMVRRYIQLLEADCFGELMKSLPENARTYLGMAEYLYREVEADPEGDHACTLIEYCRALEETLRKLIVKPWHEAIKAYLERPENAHVNELLQAWKGPNADAIRQLATRDHLELGKLTRLLRQPSSNIPQSIRNLWKESLVTAFPGLQSRQTLLPSQLLDQIDMFRKEFRNVAAHTDPVRLELVAQGRAHILGIGKTPSIIKQLIICLE